MSAAAPADAVERVEAQGQTLAFVDLGTHAVRLLLVRVAPSGAITTLSQQRQVVRLGEGAAADGALQPEAMQRAIVVARAFADMARAAGARTVVAIATSATREAPNQAAFVERLHREAGLSVRVVSGDEEARLAYLGVTSGVDLGGDTALILDIGGGSTELIVGDAARLRFACSLHVGALQLTAQFLPGETGPVPSDRFAAIKRHVRHVAGPSIEPLRTLRVQRAIGSSGSIETLADVAARKCLGRRRRPGDVLTRAQLDQVILALCALSLEARRALPGMDPGRADIIVAGAAILQALMDVLGVEALHVTDRGVREGLLVDHLATAHPRALEGRTVRERSVLQLGRRCSVDERHARTVQRLALALFDDARALGLHAETEDDRARELLGHAAMLHDVGAFLSYRDRRKLSALVIRHADLVGFDPDEVAFIAALERLHRKRPPAGKGPKLAALDDSARRAIGPLAALLRLAECLDQSRAGLVTRAALAAVDDETVAIDISCARGCPLEVWAVEAGAGAFEQAFGRGLVVRVVGGDGISVTGTG